MIERRVLRVISAAILFGVALFMRIETAMAEDSPAVTPEPNEETVTKADMENFVDLMFSKRNAGMIRPRDGKVHKWIGPIKIHVFWPRCEEVVGAYVK